VILSFTGNVACDQPLALFLKVSISVSCVCAYAILLFIDKVYLFTSTLVILAADASTAIRNAAVTVLVVQNVFTVIVTVFGTIWVVSADTCVCFFVVCILCDSLQRDTAPSLWVMSVVLVALGYFQGLLSIIIVSISCYVMYKADDKPSKDSIQIYREDSNR